MTPASPGDNAHGGCCPEYARMSRRGLLGSGFGAALAAGGISTVMGSAVLTASPAHAAGASADSVLVVLSLRGAADGLSLVVPYTDPTYYRARPRIAIPADTLVPQTKNGQFGFHPRLAGLTGLWQAGELAVVHGVGLPAPNRSHFSAIEEIEDAAPGSTTRQGWLNRMLGELPGRSPLEGFALSGTVPASLSGAEPMMSASRVDKVAFAAHDQWDKGGRMPSLRTMWGGAGGPLGRAMRSAFDSVDDFAPVKSQPSRADDYPDSDLGRAMAEAARIIRGDVGVDIITLDQGDWDMHNGLGTLEWGRMRTCASEFADSLSAFFDDLGSQRGKVTVVAFSEFGRRVKENSSFGLDHGYGNAMFLAGPRVRGGYHGTLAALSDDLDADVPVTTDYRSVLSEVVRRQFGLSPASVFPSFTPHELGVMKPS